MPEYWKKFSGQLLLPLIFSWVNFSFIHILEKTLWSASIAFDFFMGEFQFYPYIEKNTLVSLYCL
jgi:hypothetical protein